MPDTQPAIALPFVTDLRTGTEVHPDVVTHHAAFLQGAPYHKPGDAPIPAAAPAATPTPTSP